MMIVFHFHEYLNVTPLPSPPTQPHSVSQRTETSSKISFLEEPQYHAKIHLKCSPMDENTIASRKQVQLKNKKVCLY